MDDRVPGQYYDAEINLHYNLARYYGPQLGRYITSDPIGLGGGLNSYIYSGANPITSMDPYGLKIVTGEWSPAPRLNPRDFDVAWFDTEVVAPNLYAFAIGSLASPYAAISTQIIIGGSLVLNFGLELLKKIDEKAGPIIYDLNKAGPTALCMGTQ